MNGEEVHKKQFDKKYTTPDRLASISKELEYARRLIVTGQAEESKASLESIYRKYQEEGQLAEILDSVLNAVLTRFNEVNEKLLFDELERESSLYKLLASICEELNDNGHCAAAAYLLLQLDKKCGLEPELVLLLGLCLDSIRSFEAAEEALERLKLKTDCITKINQERYAILLSRRGRREEAIMVLDRLITENPKAGSLYNNRACLLATYRRQEQTREAIRDWKKAEKLTGDNKALRAKIISNLANEYRKIGNHYAAERGLKKALELNKDNRYLFYIGISRLERTELKEGWDQYEERLNRSELSMFARRKECIWRGESPDDMKTLHCVWEQGLGDTLMMVRFIPILEAAGYTVKLYVQKSLLELANRSKWAQDCQAATLNEVDELIRKLPTRDKILPMMSVAYAASRLEMLDWGSCEYPYIRIDKDKARYYKDYLEQEKRWQKSKVSVGICWQGNPMTEVGSLAGRSANPKEFKKLMQQSDLLCIPLHERKEIEQLEKDGLGHLITNSSKVLPSTYSLDELAALISVLDIVITVDTAVAHLCGGLGTKTLLLLHDSPDWRWSRKGQGCLVYPTITIARQQQRGEWSFPITEAEEWIKKQASQIRV